MKIWRMAFRVGEEGFEMWDRCRQAGVAAITYSPFREVDLSEHPPNELKKQWDQLSPAQKYSLRKVACEMKKGDVIYAKQGREIVGKGIVSGSYRFDKKARVVDDRGVAWRHQVPVEWDRSFRKVRVGLGGAQPFTVRELSSSASHRVDGWQQRAKNREERQSAMEGEMERREANFRKRNAGLIRTKKEMSDYRCEACSFSFGENYGAIGDGYIIAHHAKPLGPRRRSQETTLEDIRLLCANCHAIVHKEAPPLSVETLRQFLKKARGSRSPRLGRRRGRDVP